MAVIEACRQRQEEVQMHVVMQATMQLQRNAVVCKFGVRLPRSRAEAFELDKSNRTAKWQAPTALELDQLAWMNMRHSSTEESRLLVQVDSRESTVTLFLIANKICDTRLVWWREAT